MFFIGIFGIGEKELGSERAAGVRCSYCGQMGTQQVTVVRRYFHFFWIPVFTVGKRAYAECMHCRRFLRQEEFDEVLRSVVKQFDSTSNR